MILVNTDHIIGRDLIMIGLVKGSTVQTRNIGRDFAAGFKNMVGGELKGYTELLNDARTEATNRMVAEAQALGADAVINVRFSSASITQGAAEVLVYGTAVKFK